MSFALLIDFGSTYTKLRAVDLDGRTVVASVQGPSTVTTDVNTGLDAALEALRSRLGGLPRFRHRLAASSAAGGLRMVTVGLVRELTAEAARQAALGAGAKLVASFAYRLTTSDLARIDDLAPDILLLVGGTDGGNTEVILHNARAIAATALECPVVVAGNREATDAVVAMLRSAGKVATGTANVMPDLGQLDIEPARAAIRAIFMDRIVHAKGIDRAGARIDAVLMPTPAAVLEGAKLLAEGLSHRPGLGPLVVVDPGGATTDVHSIGDGEPAEPGVVRTGLPEPHAKRTVEGDLGMRHNASSLVAEVGLEALADQAGVSRAAAQRALDRMLADVQALPVNDDEIRLDQSLVRAAVRIAIRRHAGTRETVYTTQGPIQVQRGKDLANVTMVIGTGGAIVHARDPAAILEAATADAAERTALLPRAPRLALDREYVLYGAGLLAQVEPAAAFDLARRHLQMLEGVSA